MPDQSQGGREGTETAGPMWNASTKPPKQGRNDEHNWECLTTRREYTDLVVSSATAIGDSQEKEPTT